MVSHRLSWQPGSNALCAGRTLRHSTPSARKKQWASTYCRRDFPAPLAHRTDGIRLVMCDPKGVPAETGEGKSHQSQVSHVDIRLPAGRKVKAQEVQREQDEQ
jgi:hypothetical protein